MADSGNGLQVVDISKPTNPAIVGLCVTQGNACYVTGSYAYMTYDDLGLQVIDVSDPNTPSILGSCATPDDASSVYVTDSYVYVADDDSGLQVIEKFKPLKDITYLDSNTVSVTIPPGFRPGTYNLHVTNPDGGHAILHNAFSVYQNYCIDADSDGYGDAQDCIQAVSAPNGYVSNNVDCDDNDLAKFPGNTETCDGKDNDCDGQIDEGYTIYYKDEDNDGQGITGDNRCLSGPDAKVVYGYEKGKGYFRVKETENMGIGKGYWILLNEAKTYSITGEIIDKYKLSVQDGWYMIGGCTSNAKAFVDNGKIEVIYNYNTEIGYQRILESEVLKPCKGYWICLTDPAQLKVSSTIDPNNDDPLDDPLKEKYENCSGNTFYPEGCLKGNCVNPGVEERVFHIWQNQFMAIHGLNEEEFESRIIISKITLTDEPVYIRWRIDYVFVLDWVRSCQSESVNLGNYPLSSEPSDEEIRNAVNIVIEDAEQFNLKSVVSLSDFLLSNS